MNTTRAQTARTSRRPKVQQQLPPAAAGLLTHHDSLRPARQTELGKDGVRIAGNNADGAAWVFLKSGQVCGSAGFHLLPWDSEQLQTKAGRLDQLVALGPYHEERMIKESLLESALREIRARAVRHLSIRVDASDLSSLHVVEKADFITVDSLLTFAIDLSDHSSPAPDTDFSLRLATAEDADEAAALARNAYVYDRFHSDPFINGALADELHATWVHNSCTGKAADSVLLAEDQTGLLGFVTCTLKQETTQRSGGTSGTIILVATAERARGRGIGYATTMAALKWFRSQGCEHIEVGTQLRNIPAARLYQRCGFSIVGSSISLRKLL
jgi:dTDP-4-amino-4,6-dideoxy-D-galactose acyltransferase